MLRQAVIGITLALLVSVSAQGSIDQGQGLSIGTANTIDLIRGSQNAQWSQNLTVQLIQGDDTGSGLVLAKAYSFGFTGAVGGTLGLSSLLGVGQVGMIPTLGAGSLLIPSAGSASGLLAQARLNSLLLIAR